MITRPTVLILGAGSNVEYDFPTGDKLRIEIIDGLGRPGTAQQGHFINSLSYGQDYLIKFARDFKKSSESIDRFLEENTHYKQIGYRAIAYSLTRYARNADLYRTATPRWYDYLWRTLDEGHDDFINNKLSIITFNYDRSLEHYLAMALRQIHHLNDVKIGESLRHLKFIHLYGTIGGQPFIDDPHPVRGEPVSFDDTSRLKDSAATIKITKRSTDDSVSDAFKAAHKEISKAEYIFILGFGFDSLNCKHLAIADHIRSDARVYATAYGIGRSIMDDVQVLLGLDESVCTLYAASCRELFDNYRSLPRGIVKCCGSVSDQAATFRSVFSLSVS